MNVSLILATYGRTDEVGRFIDSLLVQSDRNFELLVLDQNQDARLDGYVRAARDGGIDVTHERLASPGLSMARNRGIALARHEVLAFPDDDCWYEPNVIAQVRACFLTMPAAGVVARWVEQSGSEPTLEYQLSLRDWRNFRGGHASSITLFLNRSLFLALHGFDERLGIGKWYGASEETDFVLRALTSGATLIHMPKIHIHHALAPDLGSQWWARCRQARARGRGTGALYAKHNLSPFVILRGLVGPILKALPRCAQPAWLAHGMFTSLGRLEGFLKWKWREQQSTNAGAL